jgi:hypothetical protein
MRLQLTEQRFLGEASYVAMPPKGAWIFVTGVISQRKCLSAVLVYPFSFVRTPPK